MECCYGTVESVQKYIDEGANDFKDAILWACKGGKRDIIDLIMTNITANWDKQRITNTIWLKAFEGACENGDPELVAQFQRKLLPKNRRLRRRRKAQTNAEIWNIGLRGACKGKNIDLVETMIQHGATDMNGALDSACATGYLPIIHILINNGANDWEGVFPNACICVNQIVTDLILGKLKKQHGEHWSAVHKSILNNALISVCKSIYSVTTFLVERHFKTIEFLISEGADDFNGGLRVACLRDSIDLAQLMLKKGADDFYVGFISACEYKNVNLARMMFKCSPDTIHDVDFALFHTRFGCNCEISKFLINYGAMRWDYVHYDCIYRVVNQLHLNIRSLRWDGQRRKLLKESFKQKIKKQLIFYNCLNLFTTEWRLSRYLTMFVGLYSLTQSKSQCRKAYPPYGFVKYFTDRSYK